MTVNYNIIFRYPVPFAEKKFKNAIRYRYFLQGCESGLDPELMDPEC
jgi:hypothetical protein